MKILLLIIFVLLCPLVAQNGPDDNIKDDIFIFRKDKILPKYRNGDFSVLQKEIRTKQYQVDDIKWTIFLTIWEAKISFCLGNIEKAKNIKNNNLQELTESYTSGLLHKPTSNNIYNCQNIIKNDECLCTKGGLDRDSDNLDFFDEIDDHFIDMYLFFQKRDIKSIKTDDESDKLSFNDLYYPVEYKSSIRYDLKNNVTTKLFFLNEAPTNRLKFYDFDDFTDYEINNARLNRIKKIRNERIDLKFDYAYKSRNYTTNSLRYLPKLDSKGKPLEGFVLIADSPDSPHYRYYFDLSDEVENENSEKIVPIFWPKTKRSGDRWQIVPEGDTIKIRLLIHEKYVEAIDLNYLGDVQKNINDYFEDEAIYVDPSLDSLSSKKWEKLVEENDFRIKEVEITLSDEIQNEQLNITLTNEYSGYEEEKRKRFISNLLIAIGISLNLILSLM